MESLGHEVVPFEDVVCQMWDMLKLGDRTYVTLQVGPTRYSCERLQPLHEAFFARLTLLGRSSDGTVALCTVSVDIVF